MVSITNIGSLLSSLTTGTSVNKNTELDYLIEKDNQSQAYVSTVSTLSQDINSMYKTVRELDSENAAAGFSGAVSSFYSSGDTLGLMNMLNMAEDMNKSELQKFYETSYKVETELGGNALSSYLGTSLEVYDQLGSQAMNSFTEGVSEIMSGKESENSDISAGDVFSSYIDKWKTLLADKSKTDTSEDINKLNEGLSNAKTLDDALDFLNTFSFKPDFS